MRKTCLKKLARRNPRITLITTTVIAFIALCISLFSPWYEIEQVHLGSDGKVLVDIRTFFDFFQGMRVTKIIYENTTHIELEEVRSTVYWSNLETKFPATHWVFRGTLISVALACLSQMTVICLLFMISCMKLPRNSLLDSRDDDYAEVDTTYWSSDLPTSSDFKLPIFLRKQKIRHMATILVSCIACFFVFFAILFFVELPESFKKDNHCTYSETESLPFTSARHILGDGTERIESECDSFWGSNSNKETYQQRWGPQVGFILCVGSAPFSLIASLFSFGYYFSFKYGGFL